MKIFQQKNNPNHKASTTIALLFFFGWVAFSIIIADFPPPSGFWTVPAVLFGLSLLIYKYCIYFYSKFDLPSWKSFFLNLLLWSIFGLILGTIMGFLPGGDPSLPAPPTVTDHLIGILILTIVALINSIGFYLFSWLCFAKGWFKKN